MAIISVLPEKNKEGDHTGNAKLIIDDEKIHNVVLSGRALQVLMKDCYLVLKRLEIIEVAEQFYD